MMQFGGENFFFSLLLSSIICTPQINLHLTDQLNDGEIEHDCLRVTSSGQIKKNIHQVISYCLTESSSQWHIQPTELDPKLSFADLSKRNINSQQLYLWSASMDFIEHYQWYLNQLTTSSESSSMASQFFYNCTLPRFGPLCQYSFDIYESYHVSLNEMIDHFYRQEYEPITLTCYVHLECNRGSRFTCLDWSEICDGHVDCIDNAVDEKYCWTLHMNECEETEYRCNDGYCIDKIFFRDSSDTYECLDRSDEGLSRIDMFQLSNAMPSFATEDIICPARIHTFGVKLTSSCVPNRDKLIKRLIFLDTPQSLSDMCWLAVKCHHSLSSSSDLQCNQFNLEKTYTQIINDICLDTIVIPAGLLAFGHMYLAFRKVTLLSSVFLRQPDYVCYNDQLCGGFTPNATLLTFNATTCRRPNDFPLKFPLQGKASWIEMMLKPLYVQLYHCNTIEYHSASNCVSSNMYQCANSTKCISNHRLCDGRYDCDFKDDEYCPLINGTCLTNSSQSLFKCPMNNKCISFRLTDNDVCDCETDEAGFCHDENPLFQYLTRSVMFPTICDGFTELMPVVIDGQNVTDESECEHWQCNNTYTRCDGFWNCFDGADEVDCDPSPLIACPSYHHLCVSLYTYQLICLPLAKVSDGTIDCAGATDEPKLCRSRDHQHNDNNLHCPNDSSHPCIPSRRLCYRRGQCAHQDDMFSCKQTGYENTIDSICASIYTSIRTDVHNFLCAYPVDTSKPSVVYFSIEKVKEPMVEDLIIDSVITRDYDQRCHRGLPAHILLDMDKNRSIPICFCPPTFYGNQCQYQNQRVSLTVQFQTFSDSRQTIFALIISLIDHSNERIVHSYEQITYLSTHHCRTKFNIYLLYSTRPKHPSNNHSIHIDVYEKTSLTYRGSLFVPIHFPFLPVHRIAVQLHLPQIDDSMNSCSEPMCIHGQCINYTNNPKDITSFCRCQPGWSGRYCNISYTCTCSLDSVCVGVTGNNRPICLCPPTKWGSRCLLDNLVCQSGQNSTCLHDGQCIPVMSHEQFICICPKGFSGKRCDIRQSTIILSFDKHIPLPQVILIHFIRIIDHAPPENGSTFKTIPANQSPIIIRWSRPFHIVFAELFDDTFYLITVQKTHNHSTTIKRTIDRSDRCEHLSEVFNETIVQLHLLRRIKYYHLPCQRRSPLLSCFYDVTHFCLCNQFGDHRVANCFEFNSAIKHDCFGQSNCENGAKCLQDNATCPQTSMCVCPKCFYGTRCQFTSTLFGLSLDAILGYHIQPHTTLVDQPRIIQVSAVMTIIMTLVGLINGLLSLITLLNKETQKVGCGIYLLGSSVTSILTTTFYALKFWILIIAQKNHITDRFFLSAQCQSVDFLMQVCLNMDKWLNACVAAERAFTVIKGTKFNKQRSRLVAKYIILILLLLIVSTTVRDSIDRRLLFDNGNKEEERIWCIISYSVTFQTVDTFIRMFHFFVPFIVNIIAATIIIVITARQRKRLASQQNHQHLLRQHLQQHCHLLIAPALLVILALPRLIISFLSGCMKSTGDSWLYLAGYLVSFIPPMLCFVIFILPSKLYKKQFRTTIMRYQKVISTQISVLSPSRLL